MIIAEHAETGILPRSWDLLPERSCENVSDTDMSLSWLGWSHGILFFFFSVALILREMASPEEDEWIK